MLFSVIVPVYNVEKYIRQCLDSIAEQDFTDFEVILVDDGFPDNCPSICDAYAKKDSRFKVIHKENGGLVSARQEGIKAANGEYIICIDSDDSINRGYFRKASEIIKEYSPDMITFDLNYVSENDKALSSEPYAKGYYDKKKKEEELYPFLILSPEMKHAHYFTFSKVFKRELVYDIQLGVSNKINMGEDVCLSVPALINANSVYVSDFIAYNITVHQSSMSRKFNPKHFEEIKMVTEYLLDKAGKNNELVAQSYRYFAFLVFVLLANAAEQNCPEAKKEIKLFWDGRCAEFFGKAQFGCITRKSEIALGLIGKNKFNLAYLFLKLCGLMKKIIK